MVESSSVSESMRPALIWDCEHAVVRSNDNIDNAGHTHFVLPDFDVILLCRVVWCNTLLNAAVIDFLAVIPLCRLSHAKVALEGNIQFQRVCPLSLQ